MEGFRTKDAREEGSVKHRKRPVVPTPVLDASYDRTSSSGNAETVDVVCDSMSLVQPKYRVCGGEVVEENVTFCTSCATFPLSA